MKGLLKKADQYPGDRKESNLTNKAAQSNEALAPTNNDELVQKLQISEERNRILERKNDEKQRELNQERIDHQEAARNYRVAATNCREVANNYRKAAKERDEYRQKLFAQKPLFEVGFQVRQGKLDSYRRDLGRSYIPVHISNRNKKCHDGAIDEDRCMVNTSDLSSREDSRLDIMKIYRFPAWTDEPIGSVHKKIVNMIGNLTYHDFFEKANETEKARVSKLSDDAWDTAKRILESYHLDRAAAMEDIDAELKGTHDELANITNNVVKEYMDTKYPNQEGGRGGCHGVARKQWELELPQLRHGHLFQGTNAETEWFIAAEVSCFVISAKIHHLLGEWKLREDGCFSGEDAYFLLSDMILVNYK